MIPEHIVVINHGDFDDKNEKIREKSIIISLHRWQQNFERVMSKVQRETYISCKIFFLKFSYKKMIKNI
jgi:hypothetical protein